MKAYNARGKIMSMSRVAEVGVRRSVIHKYITKNEGVLTNQIIEHFENEYEVEDIQRTLKWLSKNKFIENERINRYFAYSYCKKWEVAI